MEKLAIFDVDFTITRRETLLEFYIFMVKRRPWLLLYAPFGLFSAFLFFIGVISAKKAKENFIYFIKGIGIKEMDSLVENFYRERLSKIFYRDAIEKIKHLKEKGFKICLISASAEFYLKKMYNIKEVDVIMGSIFSVKNGVYSNKIEGENCKGEEKVLRLKKYLDKKNIQVDFKNSYMFSDSLSDLPLFKLVGNPYLINFKGKDAKGIPILKWV